MTILDKFFDDSPAKSEKRTRAAQEFFEGNRAGRVASAKKALATFNKLPDNLRAAVFKDAGFAEADLRGLRPAQRVRLLRAAEKIAEDVAKKLELAKAAAAAVRELVYFKGDKD